MTGFADSVKQFGDRLANLVSGLGTQKDKNTSNMYGHQLVTPDQLLAAYSDSWMAAKIIDIPAEDATAKWRKWQAERGEITLIEALEKEHNLQEKLKEAMIKARLLGGSAIVIGVEGAGEWDEELTPERVKKGALKYLHVVDRTEISAQEIERDLNSRYYGQPKLYRVNSTGATVTIHPSRVVRLLGRKYPLRALEVDGWGQSVLQPCDSAIKNAELACEGTATMINEASIDVISIPDFMSSLGDPEYRTRIIERFQLAATAKSIVRATILDKEEEWNKLATSFASLPELINVYLGIVAGAADIPATRMLGQSPGGLNATGESDLTNYYDNIRSTQDNELTPAMRVLDDVLIYSALGKRPESIYYTWAPLWQPSDSQKADTLLKRTQSVAAIYNTGYVPDAVMAKGVQNMLVEDGSLPGLDQALAEYEAGEGDDDLDEDDPDTSEQFARRGETESDE